MKRLLVLGILCGCGSHGGGLSKSATAIIGVWKTSSVSYDDAERSSSATEFDADGSSHVGSWRDGTFQVDARADSELPTRWTVDEAAHKLHVVALQAHEDDPIVFDGPDRWRTMDPDDPQKPYYFYVRAK